MRNANSPFSSYGFSKAPFKEAIKLALKTTGEWRNFWKSRDQFRATGYSPTDAWLLAAAQIETAKAFYLKAIGEFHGTSEEEARERFGKFVSIAQDRAGVRYTRDAKLGLKAMVGDEALQALEGAAKFRLRKAKKRMDADPAMQETAQALESTSVGVGDVPDVLRSMAGPGTRNSAVVGGRFDPVEAVAGFVRGDGTGLGLNAELDSTRIRGGTAGDVLAAVKGKRCGHHKAIEWAAEYSFCIGNGRHVPLAILREAPSLMAVTWLMQATKSEAMRQAFFTQVVTKIVPSKSALDSESKVRDDSSRHGELIDSVYRRIAGVGGGGVPALRAVDPAVEGGGDAPGAVIEGAGVPQVVAG